MASGLLSWNRRLSPESTINDIGIRPALRGRLPLTANGSSQPYGVAIAPGVPGATMPGRSLKIPSKLLSAPVVILNPLPAMAAVRNVHSILPGNWANPPAKNRWRLCHAGIAYSPGADGLDCGNKSGESALVFMFM